MIKKVLKILIVFLTALTIVSCVPEKVIEESNLHTVSFNTQGGSLIEDVKIETDDYLLRPENPVKDQYTFINWYLADDYSVRYNFKKVVEESFTLYARWSNEVDITFDGLYNNKEDVALYLVIYEKLPSNYRLKGEINGHISKYWTRENMLTIGGDIFQNREGLLPKLKSRHYKEVDIDYRGESNRGSKRIVYSNDGMIYYTADHYGSFTQFNERDLKW